MKAAKDLYLFLFFMLFPALSSLAQEGWKLLTTIQVGNAHHISSDSYNNIYIADAEGIVSQYDSLGRKITFFSPGKKGKITSMDGSRNVNIFLFYKNFQEFRLLNRFLTEISTTRINNNQIGFASLGALSQDNALWIVDEGDLTLKKVNLKFNQIIVNSSLLPVLPRSKNEFVFTHFKEYSNNLYLSDRENGIFVFDNLGNYKTLIQAHGIDYFDFRDNYLYFLDGTKLTLLDLTNGQIRVSEKEFPQKAKIIFTSRKCYILDQNQLTIFEHNILGR